MIQSSVEKKQGKRDWQILFRPREEKDFETPKILIRQTADKIVAAIDDIVGYYPIDTVNLVKLYNGDIDYNLSILGILNSKLITFFYQEISQEGGRILAQVKPSRIKAIPIPPINDALSISTHVQNIINLKKEGKPSGHEEAKVDKLVYELYELTDEEIKIVEGT